MLTVRREKRAGSSQSWHVHASAENCFRAGIGSLAIVLMLRILCGCAIRRRLARPLIILPILYWPLGMLSLLLLLHSGLYVLVFLLAALSWFLQDYRYARKKRT